MSSFSENLRRIRFELHMTQEEFADLLGTTKQNISRYESGAVSPKITTAKAIAEKLGRSLSELSGEAPQAETPTTLHQIGQQLTAPPRSKEWRIISHGLGEMEKINPDLFMTYFKMFQASHPELFNDERIDDDDPRS